MPSLALAKTASSAGMARSSSSSNFAFGISELGRSILFITGINFKLSILAMWAFAMVCASIPCEASMTRRAPSEAIKERETS